MTLGSKYPTVVTCYVCNEFKNLEDTTLYDVTGLGQQIVHRCDECKNYEPLVEGVNYTVDPDGIIETENVTRIPSWKEIGVLVFVIVAMWVFLVGIGGVQ